jgi:hypothetical protein
MSNVTVSTTAGLEAALKSAHSGDTILLQAGTYSGVSIANLTFASGVTVTSADVNHQAVITDMNVQNVNGLTLSQIEFNETGTGYNISKSENITFNHDYVHGALGGNVQSAPNGLSFLDSSNVTVENSEFTQLKTAIGIGANTLTQVDNINVLNNNIHDLSRAGVVLAGASEVNVSGNLISGITAADGTHPDAIQFFTTGTTQASQDINVSNNVILKGDGVATQGIFFRDQVGDLHFQNVTIDNNLVVGTGYDGISVNGVNGASISGNELISNPGATNNTWMLVTNGSNVTSTDNSAQSISFTGVTNVKETGDILNAPVTDGGLAAVEGWASTHAINPDALTIAAAMAHPADPMAAALPAAVAEAAAVVEPPTVDLATLTNMNLWNGMLDL